MKTDIKIVAGVLALTGVAIAVAPITCALVASAFIVHNVKKHNDNIKREQDKISGGGQ